MTKEDWEVEEDQLDPRRARGGDTHRKMSEAPYARNSSADAAYEQRGPAYDNYNIPPQAARAGQDVRVLLFAILLPPCDSFQDWLSSDQIPLTICRSTPVAIKATCATMTLL